MKVRMIGKTDNVNRKYMAVRINIPNPCGVINRT